jgi:hypothetical protein
MTDNSKGRSRNANAKFRNNGYVAMLKSIEGMTKNIEGIDPNQPFNKAKQVEQNWIKALQGHKQQLERVHRPTQRVYPLLNIQILVSDLFGFWE